MADRLAAGCACRIVAGLRLVVRGALRQQTGRCGGVGSVGRGGVVVGGAGHRHLPGYRSRARGALACRERLVRIGVAQGLVSGGDAEHRQCGGDQKSGCAGRRQRASALVDQPMPSRPVLWSIERGRHVTRSCQGPVAGTTFTRKGDNRKSEIAECAKTPAQLVGAEAVNALPRRSKAALIARRSAAQVSVRAGGALAQERPLKSSILVRMVLI